MVIDQEHSANEGSDEVLNTLVKNLAPQLKLLSDRSRLRILWMLTHEGEMNVTEMCVRLNSDQPAVSHHLALLRLGGLVEARRNGKNNYYGIRDQSLKRIFSTLFTETGLGTLSKKNPESAIASEEICDEQEKITPRVSRFERKENTHVSIANSQNELHVSEVATPCVPVVVQQLKLEQKKPAIAPKKKILKPSKTEVDPVQETLHEPVVRKTSQKNNQKINELYNKCVQKMDEIEAKKFKGIWEFSAQYPQCHLLDQFEEIIKQESLENAALEMIEFISNPENVVGLVFHVIHQRTPETHHASLRIKWKNEGYSERILTGIANGRSLLDMARSVGQELAERWKVESLREWK